MKRVDVRDTDGGIVKVFPSSGVAVMTAAETIDGPFVWLAIQDRTLASTCAHLTVDQARSIRNALNAFVQGALIPVAHDAEAGR